MKVPSFSRLIFIFALVFGFIALWGATVNAEDCEECHWSPGCTSEWSGDPGAGEVPDCDNYYSYRSLGWCVLGGPEDSCSESSHATTHIKGWTFHDITTAQSIACSIELFYCDAACGDIDPDPCIEICNDQYDACIDSSRYCVLQYDQYGGYNNGCL